MHAKYRNIDSDAVCIVCVLRAASDPVILLGCTPPLFLSSSMLLLHISNLLYLLFSFSALLFPYPTHSRALSPPFLAVMSLSSSKSRLEECSDPPSFV